MKEFTHVDTEILALAVTLNGSQTLLSFYFQVYWIYPYISKCVSFHDCFKFAVLLEAYPTKSNDVYVSDNETDVSLSCEMSLYLRPERDLQWFRGGQQIMNTGRHMITYTDGNGMGQFGGNTIGSSRVSTLVISEPQLSDSGTYTCAIRNTEVSQDIELTVESAGQYLYNPLQPVH